MVAEFLCAFRPGGPWVLTSIALDKLGITTKTFSDAGEAEAWARGQNKSRNLYFSVNPTLKPVSKKANKEQIARVEYLHCDLDPRPAEDLDAERERIRSRLNGALPKDIPAPTFTLDSGGGYWGLWRLADPIELQGDAAKIAAAEGYNRELANRLGGDDGTWNVDRIARLPGLTNWPDAAKLKKGRVARSAVVCATTNAAYPLAAFRCAVVSPTATGAKDASRLPRSALPLGDGPPMGTEELRAWAAANGKTIHDATLARIATGADPLDPTKYPSRSEALFAVCCELVRAEVPDDVIFAVITDKGNEIAASVREQRDWGGYAQRQIGRAREDVGELPAQLYPDSPLDSARKYIERRRPTLMHNNDDWLAFDGAAYAELEDMSVRAELYAFLDRAVTPGKDDAPPRPFNPNKTKVANVVDALQGVAHRPRDTFAPPCWLEGEGPPPHELVACRNGLLHLPSSELLELTPRFFTRNALTFEYNANAPEPSGWLRFLGELWPEEPDAIATLQEVFGYALIPDTSQQKIFMLVGPKRSGKGTVARVLTELVGRHNTCAPTLSSLSEPFGLEGLVGKQLAIASDVRLGGKTDHAALAENLLRISGEDMVTVGRKYKRAWDGKLSVRFMIMTNIMPKFADASGALANRFVPLVMSQSFFGRENPALLNALLTELPGVLNWAIEGWRRLKARGHFAMPASSREAVQNLADMASPEAAFIRDECELNTPATTPKAELFAAWQAWCTRNNVFANTLDVFSARLQAASNGHVAVAKLRADGGKRMPSFRGIRLLSMEEKAKRDEGASDKPEQPALNLTATSRRDPDDDVPF